jgi:4-hydroxy-4-methyl-2-oxoglutarate aldolase
VSKRFLPSEFSSLSTPLIADACLRVKVPLRVAPSVIRPLVRGVRVAGRVLPARHRGSVDVFLEAMKKALPGDVLVIDNEGRSDESCVGDLTVLEARAWSLAGLVVRGHHRDTDELVRIGFPVFSYGSYPAGPRRLDKRMSDDLASAQWDDFSVDSSDVVFADDDGVLFVQSSVIEKVLEAAKTIWKVERNQAELIQAGKKLSAQLDFDSYLAKRNSDPSYTLRKHLRDRGGAVEE